MRYGITLYTEQAIAPELPETEKGWKRCDITGLWFDSVGSFSLEEADKLLVEAGYTFDRVDVDGWHAYYTEENEGGFMANIIVLEEEL